MAMRSSLTAEIPPLENGDCLTRDEFERRYEASPHIKKAELIDGLVFVASPVSTDHSGTHPLALSRGRTRTRTCTRTWSVTTT